jgi:uroporphyrinogen decarboxylase
VNNRERVLSALNHHQPDRTPYQIGFTQKMHAQMAEYYGDRQFERRLDNCITALRTEPQGGWREVAPDIWEDQFGVRWNRSVDKDIGVVCNQVITPKSVEDYPFPDPLEATRWAGYPSPSQPPGDRFVVASLGFSLFERAWTMAGMEALLIAMVDDKPFANRLLDRILEFNLLVIEQACGYAIDGMQFGDDWGMQRGLLMGPQLWREFIKPRIKQMYGLAKSKGKAVLIHSCGKVDAVFPDLIECGLDVFNPFQPEVMDVYEVKRVYGDRLSFFGGISTQRTLPYATVDETRAEVRQLVRVVGRNGGYIAAPAHSIPGGARPENVAAMIEVLQDQ